MCKAPKPPKPKEPKKPQFLRNRYLDEFVGDAQAVSSLRTGRGTLRIPMGSPSVPGSRVPGTSLTGDSRVPRPANPNPSPVRPILDEERRRLGPNEHRR